jgi:hypothetical protein
MKMPSYVSDELEAILFKVPWIITYILSNYCQKYLIIKFA